MTGTAGALHDAADRLRDALDVYDRFVDGWPYERGRVPVDVETYAADHAAEGSGVGSPAATGRTLSAAVEAAYRRARDAAAAYVQRARARGRSDWASVAAETARVREAVLEAHAAGYGVDPETGDPGYLVPEFLCPTSHLSMNAGSAPVTYEARVAQYRAVADRFALAPDVVYHPGAGHDVSPSGAFPTSRVVYADVDPAATADLRRAGYEAVRADAAGYDLSRGADVVVFRNAGLLEEAVVAATLRPGGWVVANDHLESARHVSRLDALDLVGVVPDEWTGAAPPVCEVGDASAPRRWSGGDPARDRTGRGGRDARQSAEPGSPPSGDWSPLALYVFHYAE